MYKYLLIVIMLMSFGTALASQEEKSDFDFNKDRFLAGSTMVQDQANVDDLFMAGETLRSKQNIAGSAHLAGRKIISTGVIGGDAYLAGMDLLLEGKVAGDATLAGYNVQVGEVTGDLRVSGANLTISGPVAGYALIAGNEVRFESIIQGDVSLTAKKTHFAEGARIDGKLTIYEEKVGEMEIPSQVISSDRVERKVAEWSDAAKALKDLDWRDVIAGFLGTILVVAGIAALIAAIAPQKMADLRRRILDRPFRALWIGILAESVIIGVTIILMMTVIGLFLAPATVLIGLLAAYAGYIVAAYAFGVWLLMIVGRKEPNTVASKSLAAGIGALAVGLIALIPFFGWLFVMAFALAGVGSIAIWLFRPKFFAAV